jgi:hypothetical protein
MSLLGATIILAMLLLSPLQAHAEVWRCHQPNGTNRITASEQDPGACETFRLPENQRPYNPNRYFPEFYYNYYPGPQALLERALLFPFHPLPSVEFVPPPAPQHTAPRIMPLLRRR